MRSMCDRFEAEGAVIACVRSLPYYLGMGEYYRDHSSVLCGFSNSTLELALAFGHYLAESARPSTLVGQRCGRMLGSEAKVG